MSTPVAGTGRDPEDEAPPLLPGVAAHPDLASALRESLTVLRDTADGPLRRRMTDVLEGRAGLRELVRDPAFTGFVGPLTDAGWERFQREREQQRTHEVTPDEPRAEGPGGSW